MKRFLLCFGLLIVFTFNSIAQSTVAGVEKDLGTYEELMKARNYDELMNYVHPKLFDVVPKDLLITSFKQIFEGDEEIEISIGDVVPTQIMDVQEINGRRFSFVDYTMNMQMILKGEDVGAEQLQATASLLEMQFGEGNVSVEEEINALHVISSTAMIAEYIGDKWTFVQYNTQQQGLMDMLIEKEIQEKILKSRFSAE